MEYLRIQIQNDPNRKPRIHHRNKYKDGDKTCKSNSHTIQTLFLKSRRFSGERSTDFYDDYVEKCRSNSNQIQPPILSKSVEKCRSNNNNQIQQPIWSKSAEKSACTEREAISRTRSANLERVRGEEERRRDLRRSMSENCRKRAGGDEQRRVPADVEAFIARQQRNDLREIELIKRILSREIADFRDGSSWMDLILDSMVVLEKKLRQCDLGKKLKHEITILPFHNKLI